MYLGSIMTNHILLILMGLSLAIIVYRMRAKFTRLARNGQKAFGTVDAILVSRKDFNEIRSVIIKFTTANNIVISGIPAESMLPERVEKGTRVMVFYEPATPDFFLVQGMQFNTFTIAVSIASWLFALSGLVLLLQDIHLLHLY